MIILPEWTSETEHLSPGAVLSRAVAHGLSWGCGGIPGCSLSQMDPPRVLFGHQMSRKDHQTSCAVLQLPAHGLTKPWLSPGCVSLPRRSLSSHTFLSSVCTALAEGMRVLNQTPSTTFRPPSNPLKIPLYQTCKCLAPVWLLQSPTSFTNWPKHFLVEKPCIPEVFTLIKLLPYHRSWLLFL